MIQSPGDFDASRYKPIDERELNVRNQAFRDGDRGPCPTYRTACDCPKLWPLHMSQRPTIIAIRWRRSRRAGDGNEKRTPPPIKDRGSGVRETPSSQALLG